MVSDKQTLLAKAMAEEQGRLECVVTCVGWSKMLALTLPVNLPYFDNFIVVTSHEDKVTAEVAERLGALVVKTDRFGARGRLLNKGAGLDHGFYHYRYMGWRMTIDADILLPGNFRQTLMSHTYLERDCIYGADRMDVVGKEEIRNVLESRDNQHRHRSCVGGGPFDKYPLNERPVDPLFGYFPGGHFQLWHCSKQVHHPQGNGFLAQQDKMFAVCWPESHRRLLPTVICHHLCPTPPVHQEFWYGGKAPKL